MLLSGLRVGPRRMFFLLQLGALAFVILFAVFFGTRISAMIVDMFKGGMGMLTGGGNLLFGGVGSAIGASFAKIEEGGACAVGAACAGFDSVTDRHGCCNGTCQKQTLVEGLWRCPSELTKIHKDGVPCMGAQCLKCIHPATHWWSKNLKACGREPRWPRGTVCAAGTSCDACIDKKSSMWNDGKIRCGTQENTILRCCSDTITFKEKCLFKASLPKLGSGCTPGLYDPGDGKCHGAAVHRC